MAEFTIDDADFAYLKGQVVVITGGSSGIGLATTELLLSIGAFVVVGDLTQPQTYHANLTYIRTDVTVWTDLLALFTTAVQTHQRIDHVFANAGISVRAQYLDSHVDQATDMLLEPTQQVYDVNLRGVVNTAYIGMHHMRQQQPPGGSVVCTASASSFQRFSGTDYASAKHAVLGFVRGITAETIDAGLPIRINAVAPSWTTTGIFSPEGAKAAKLRVQDPVVVARNVALFMADKSRRGQLVYSLEGRYFEVEESVFIPAMKGFVGEDLEEAGYIRYRTWALEQRRSQKGGSKQDEPE